MTLTSLTIKDAEAITKKTQAEGCIIICVDHEGNAKGVSYGDTMLTCRIYGKRLDKIMEASESWAG